MADLYIPPEAGMALAKEMRRQCGITIHPSTAIRAIRAMLAAWPDAVEYGSAKRGQCLSLPLTEIKKKAQPGAFDYWPAEEEGNWGDA